MANWYVRSAAAGTATGADWTNAKTTLAAAATASAAGDIIYVSEDHAETQASAMTITFPGTVASPNRVLCVNHAGSVPPVAADLATTATITTTGANAITTAGAFYCYGVIFNCGTGASAATLTLCNTASRQNTYEACQFNVVNTSASSLLQIAGSGSTAVDFVNCSASFGATGQSIQSATMFRWVNKAAVGVTGATLPTTLITLSNGSATLDAVDLSAFGSGKTLVGQAAVTSFRSAVRLTNCKLGASVTVSGTPALPYVSTEVVGCGTTTNVSRNERYLYQGTLTTETTIIRTSGASDGTTAYSWKVVTTANAKQDFPFETFEGAIWNTTTGSGKTLSIEIGGPAAMTNADVWLEVEYLGSSATPVASLVSSGPATPLTTGSALTSSAASWGSTPGTTYTLTSPSFTPQMVGPIRWKVKVAKASATIYIDPKPTVA